MQNQEQLITVRFKSHSSAEQVIMYAEALKREWYELLVILDKCVEPTKRKEFLMSVNLWLK